MRLDVRRAAREQNAVDALQYFLVADQVRERGNEERNGTGRFGHCADVFFADRVKRVHAEHAAIRRDSDDGASIERHDVECAAYAPRAFALGRGDALHHSLGVRGCFEA